MAHFSDIYLRDRSPGRAISSLSLSRGIPCVAILRSHGRPECAPDGEEGWKGIQRRVYVLMPEMSMRRCVDVRHQRMYRVGGCLERRGMKNHLP